MYLIKPITERESADFVLNQLRRIRNSLYRDFMAHMFHISEIGGIGVSKVNILELINQLATVERLIDSLSFFANTMSSTEVLLCNPTQSSFGIINLTLYPELKYENYSNKKKRISNDIILYRKVYGKGGINKHEFMCVEVSDFRQNNNAKIQKVYRDLVISKRSIRLSLPRRQNPPYSIARYIVCPVESKERVIRFLNSKNKNIEKYLINQTFIVRF
ncbi:MAG: hypothetical protein K6T83_12095 [Alicyclobacillus sp.]|nr:hypothetical protein [Alicyclobacillus sp.]